MEEYEHHLLSVADSADGSNPQQLSRSFIFFMNECTNNPQMFLATALKILKTSPRVEVQ
jgi:hypothetical protein